MLSKLHNTLLLFVLFSLCTVSLALGAVPQLINYEGKLFDAAGNPVPNGEYDVVFRIYDVSAGGTPLWTEVWDATTSRAVAINGTFNVMLGVHTPLPESFFNDHPSTFLGITIGSDSEMLPRQQITSVAYALTAGDGIPKGGIIMWSGAVDQIPAGWALCDGTNGTPDLKDKFVLGAGGALPATGGSATKNLAHVHAGPNHTHTGPSHSHVVSGNTASFVPDTGMTDDGTDQVDASRAHAHSVSITSTASGTQNTGASGTGNTGSAGSAAQDIMPPYFALAFIMKL